MATCQNKFLLVLTHFGWSHYTCDKSQSYQTRNKNDVAYEKEMQCSIICYLMIGTFSCILVIPCWSWKIELAVKLPQITSVCGFRCFFFVYTLYLYQIHVHMKINEFKLPNSHCSKLLCLHVMTKHWLGQFNLCCMHHLAKCNLG